MATACVIAIAGGCSGSPTRILPPRIDVVQAERDAMRRYDTDGNGLINGAELDAVPAIKAALDRIDGNGDASVSAEELTRRIESWKESRVGLMAVVAQVTLDGKPLPAAVVRLEPEGFLGPAVKPARGTSDGSGIVMLSVDDPALASQRITGVAPGFYRVIVTGGSGDQRAPVRYGDEQSPLGLEVAQDADWVQQNVAIALTSK